MDARIAKALRNSPHRNEFKYLYLLSNVKDEEKKREIIRLHLPSMRILIENVRRFMCVGDDFELQTAKILWKHPVPALLTHARLVHGLIIVQEYRAIQVQINFERFLDRSLVEIRRLRDLTSSQLFATPVPSPAPSLRSASSVASLSSLPGSVAGTPTRQRLAGVRRQLTYSTRESLFPPDEAAEDFETMSQVSWKSVRETFQRGISDEERRRKVTIEELDITVSSVNSQDLKYQREYFNADLQFGDSNWISEEDATGFGTPFNNPGVPEAFFDLATPLPPDDGEDFMSRVNRLLQTPNENQPFPTGDVLTTMIEQGFDKDGFRRPSSQSEKPESEWQHQISGVPHSSPQSGKHPPVNHLEEENFSPILPLPPPPPANTHDLSGPVEAATGRPVLNLAWAPFPIYVDGPEQTEPQGAGARPDLNEPQPSCSFHQDPIIPPFSVILGEFGSPDPDHPVFVHPMPKGPPLRDITRYHVTEPKIKIKRKLGPMKSRLKFQSTRLFFHCNVIRDHIQNPMFKAKDEINPRIVKISKPMQINLNNPTEERCPTKSDLPVVHTSGIFVPLIAPEPGEEDPWFGNMSSEIELEETLSHDISWETIEDEDDDDPWIVPEFPDEVWPVLEEDVIDEGWLYQHNTDFLYWQRKLRGLPLEKNKIPEFPPKFRYKRALTVSFTVLRYYPDWQTRRHPSEIPPPPPPAPLPVIPEIQPVIEEITTGVEAGATATTSGITPGAGMITDGSKSQVPSAGLVTTVSGLDPHTFSSLMKKTITGASGEEAQVHMETVPSISGPGVALPPVPEGEEPSGIRRHPAEEGAAGIPAGPVAEVPGAPGVTGVAEVPAPPPADFQFAVPEPVVRPKRVRRVPPRYEEYDIDEDDEPPRRRRRRRQRRVWVEAAEALPPPPPAEAEPIEFGEAGLIPPPPIDAEAAAVEPQEPETPKVWDPDRVKALLRRMMQEAGERVVRFTDCCEPAICPRKSSASFFSVLLVLDAEKIISLRQTSKDGSPFELLIEGSDALFDFEE